MSKLIELLNEYANVNFDAAWYRGQVSSYSIRKPGGKLRHIIAPNEDYKQTLKRLLAILQGADVFPLSETAYAWRKNRSRFSCAQLHVNQPAILEIDIKDYFTGIKGSDAHQLVQNHLGEHLAEDQCRILVGLLTYNAGPGFNNSSNIYLPQGYPTSPYIANAIRYPLDRSLEQLCASRGWTYSSYGDNMYISGDIPFEFREEALYIVKVHGFPVNFKKTQWISQAKRQEILGIVVNRRLNISRAYIQNLMDDIIHTPVLNPSLMGRIISTRIDGNDKNYNYLLNLHRRINGTTTENN